MSSAFHAARRAPALALALAFPLFSLSASSIAPQDPSGPPGAVRDLGGPAVEPPLRARVTVGNERLDVALGEETRTADGRVVFVDLLPERRFDVPGAFEFAYPHAWRFLGSVGHPGPVDAWWTLGGDGATVHLRRHDGDAAAIADLYVANMQKTGGSEPRPVTREFGGRTLRGRAVEVTVGSIGPGEARRWVQEIYSWREADGVSWMLSVQRDIGPANPSAAFANAGVSFRLEADGKLVVDRSGAPAGPPPRSGVEELERALASWRWH